jgi:type I restriction enzyme S subunit
MSDWHTYKLKDITTKIGSGSTPTGGSGAYKAEGISLIRSQNVLDYKFTEDGLAFIDDDQAYALRGVTVDANDVLLNITGDSVARCCGAPANWLPARVNQHVAILRSDPEKLDHRFLKYSLLASKEELLILSEIGGTRNALTKGMLEDYEVSLPSLPEQKAIASVLSSLDDKIDLLHRQNKTVEAMAETLFRQWFIEEAKEDWEELLVGDIAIHIKDNANPLKDPIKTFYHFSLPAFDSGQKPTIEVGSDILSNKYRVAENSILVSKLNPRIPRIWLLANVEENYVCSTEFQNLKPKVTSHLMFLYSLFSSRDVIEELTMSASGTSGSHQRVKPEDMLNITFRTPSLDYLEEYSLLITPSMQKVAFNKQQIQTLEKLRDTLLPKFMSGEVRVQYQTEEVA